MNKRMNEVFELPIDISAAYTYGFNTIAEAHKIGRCPSAQHAAHAINHVDALADALGCILMVKEDELFEDWLDKESPSGDVESVQSQFEDSPVFKDFIAEFGGAIAALKAYRGEA